MLTAESLEVFGLKPKEAKVYLAMLALGQASVQEIAKHAGLHRVSVYDLVSSLLQKGFVHYVPFGKRRHLEAQSPEQVLETLRSHERAFSELVPELTALKNKENQKPKVSYFEGRKNVWDAYLDRIRNPLVGKINLVYGNSAELLRTYPKEYEAFTKERLRRGISAKIIVERSPYGMREAERSANEMREVKFLPEGKKFKSHTVIYGNCVMTLSWESMALVIVEDQANADNQRLVWELLWKNL